MADRSWGVPASTGSRVRTGDGPADRAAARMRERNEAAAHRLETRTAAREADDAAREQARIARRERELQSAAGDRHAAAASRHRSSGRKDIVREQRDTRSYATIVDLDRLRELSRRGASVTGLAGAFGISEAEVERALANAE